MAYDGEPDDWRPERPRCRACAGTGIVPLFTCAPGVYVFADRGERVRCYWCGGTGFDDENSYGFGDMGDD
jgi:hypothetical protein